MKPYAKPIGVPGREGEREGEARPGELAGQGIGVLGDLLRALLVGRLGEHGSVDARQRFPPTKGTNPIERLDGHTLARRGGCCELTHSALQMSGSYGSNHHRGWYRGCRVDVIGPECVPMYADGIGRMHTNGEATVNVVVGSSPRGNTS